MIEIKNLNKFYNKGRQNQICAVNNTTLSLPDSGMIAFFGKSGCGKTTLLNIIGGLDKPQSGQVLLDGESVSPTSNRTRNAKIGYIFQNYNLSKSMTVYENVASSMRLCGVTDEDEIEQRTLAALKSVEMEKYRKRYPDELSGGQQQRVAIARAIVKKPDVILADEPTGNLDEQNTVMVMDLLKEISREHLVLLVTHEQDLVDLYCDEVIEIVDGAVTERYQNSTTGGFVGKRANDVYLGDMEKADVEGERLEVECFGEFASEKLKLRLISVGGVIYLSAPEGVKIKFADSSSEIKIHEGNYLPESQAKSVQMDEILKTPIGIGKCGRIYTFGKALKNAYRSSFGRKKRGRKVLIATLVLFSMIAVLMVSLFGATVYTKKKIQTQYNTNTVFVSANAITQDEVQSLFDRGLCDNIHATSMYYNEYWNSYDNYMMSIRFGNGHFETIRSPLGIEVSSNVFPISAIGDREVIVGKTKDIQKNDLYISRALADVMLESNTYENIKGYEDLINLSGSLLSRYYYYDNSDKETLKIAGVVDGDDCAMYINSLSYAENILMMTNSWAAENIYTADEMGVEGLSDGEIYIRMEYAGKDAKLPEEGTTVLLGGKEFKIKEYQKLNTGMYVADSEYYINSIVLTVNDYTDLVTHTGKTDDMFINSNGIYDLSAQIYGDTYYALHAKDINTLVETLAKKCGPDDMVTPKQIYEDKSSDYKSTAVGLTIALIIVLAVLCLCLFLIMRSSIVADIKEIGIYRAIGVSRKNIVFRYFVEYCLVFLCTVFVGFLLASFGISKISSIMGVIINSVLYYPLWLGLLTLAGLFGLSIVCGLLPVLTLIRKTPAQIISKYDI